MLSPVEIIDGRAERINLMKKIIAILASLLFGISIGVIADHWELILYIKGLIIGLAVHASFCFFGINQKRSKQT